MPLLKLNSNPTPRQLRQFAAIWLPACALVVAWFVWRNGASVTVVAPLLAVVAIVSCVGYAIPGFIRPAFVAWMAAVYPAGWLISHLLLAVVFFVVVMPIGLIMRVIGVDPMQRAWDRQASTYWKGRRQIDDIEKYFRQY